LSFTGAARGAGEGREYDDGSESARAQGRRQRIVVQ
jgi:hypothetical protein